MEFESQDHSQNEEQHLMVNLSNLVGTPNPDLIVNNSAEKGKMGTMVPEARRSSDRSKKRSSIIQNVEDTTLFEFFKSLEWKPNQGIQSTVRASYKAGNSQYNLYAVPGQKPGDKGQIYMQSQEGFNYDLPPVRLSEKERDHLVQHI
jgi:hypothetical protein